MPSSLPHYAASAAPGYFFALRLRQLGFGQGSSRSTVCPFIFFSGCHRRRVFAGHFNEISKRQRKKAAGHACPAGATGESCLRRTRISSAWIWPPPWPSFAFAWLLVVLKGAVCFMLWEHGFALTILPPCFVIGRLRLRLFDGTSQGGSAG